jgi:hypothetical protein
VRQRCIERYSRRTGCIREEQTGDERPVNYERIGRDPVTCIVAVSAPAEYYPQYWYVLKNSVLMGCDAVCLL